MPNYEFNDILETLSKLLLCIPGRFSLPKYCFWKMNWEQNNGAMDFHPRQTITLSDFVLDFVNAYHFELCTDMYQCPPLKKNHHSIWILG